MQWLAAAVLVIVMVTTTVITLPSWTIPLRILGWGAAAVVVVAIRRPKLPLTAALRQQLAAFREPVSSRQATAYLLMVGVPVTIVLVLAIVWRFV
jgi:hypothetical protein